MGGFSPITAVPAGSATTASGAEDVGNATGNGSGVTASAVAASGESARSHRSHGQRRDRGNHANLGGRG